VSIVPRRSLLFGPAGRSEWALHALDAFRRGEDLRALAFIDRCCRAFRPEVEHLRLRAAILTRLGEHGAAARDRAAAIALAPDDLALRARWSKTLSIGRRLEDSKGVASGLSGPSPVCDKPLEAVRSKPRAGMGTGPEPPVTIIVPVFRDLEATRNCLEAVLREPGLGRRFQVIVIDDASPDEALSDHLKHVAASGRIRLLVHDRNLGFIKAVRHGLAETARSDVVLLNADTVVPAGWLERLRAAAYRAGDIGTVTPLSNDGDLTSYPRPFAPTPLPDAATLALMDATAAKVNAGEVIDLPSGIGFCLYIRRSCLDAVGDFGRDFLAHGYFEDVDFSLRAAARGFRNVCATDVVVGHVGSASYGEAKRALVQRNQAAMLRRFPTLEAETDWFIARDPLRPARQRINASLWPALGQARAAVISTLAEPGLTEELLTLTRVVEPPWIEIVPRRQQRGLSVAVRRIAPDEMALDCAFSGPDLADGLTAALKVAGVSRLVFLLGAAPPDALVEMAVRLGAASEVVLADGQAFEAGSLVGLPPELQGLFAMATGVVPGCRAAGAPLSGIGTKQAPPLMRIARRPATRSRAVSLEDPLAVLPLDRGPQTFSALRSLALALNRLRCAVPLLVLGETLDDQALMRLGDVFVLGPVETGDWQSVLSIYRCRAVFVPCRRTLFADPRLPALAALDKPLAAFGQGLFAEFLAESDLRLEGAQSDASIAAAVIRWLEGTGLETPDAAARCAS